MATGVELHGRLTASGISGVRRRITPAPMFHLRSASPTAQFNHPTDGTITLVFKGYQLTNL